MATDPQNTSGQTAKRLSPTTRTFAFLLAGLTAFILASLAMLYWQGEPTSLGYWLVGLLSFIVVPSWLLLSLCGFGLWVSRVIGQRRRSAGRIWLVLAGCLAVVIAIIAVLTVVGAVCSQEAAQDACQQLVFAYAYTAFWMAAAGIGTIPVWLAGFVGAILVLGVWWVAKRFARPNG
jgi:hypothetical protein